MHLPRQELPPETISVTFVGTPEQWAALKKKHGAALASQLRNFFQVRPEVVYAWLAFLKEVHPSYADVVIDDNPDVRATLAGLERTCMSQVHIVADQTAIDIQAGLGGDVAHARDPGMVDPDGADADTDSGVDSDGGADGGAGTTIVTGGDGSAGSAACSGSAAGAPVATAVGGAATTGPHAGADDAAADDAAADDDDNGATRDRAVDDKDRTRQVKVVASARTNEGKNSTTFTSAQPGSVSTLFAAEDRDDDDDGLFGPSSPLSLPSVALPQPPDSLETATTTRREGMAPESLNLARACHADLRMDDAEESHAADEGDDGDENEE